MCMLNRGVIQCNLPPCISDKWMHNMLRTNLSSRKLDLGIHLNDLIDGWTAHYSECEMEVLEPTQNQYLNPAVGSISSSHPHVKHALDLTFSKIIEPQIIIIPLSSDLGKPILEYCVQMKDLDRIPSRKKIIWCLENKPCWGESEGTGNVQLEERALSRTW